MRHSGTADAIGLHFFIVLGAVRRCCSLIGWAAPLVLFFLIFAPATYASSFGDGVVAYGVQRDYAEAMHGYRKAADRGLAEGLLGIGLADDLGRYMTQVKLSDAVRLVCVVEGRGHETLRFVLDPADGVALSGGFSDQPFPNNVPMKVTESTLSWEVTRTTGTKFKFSLDRSTLQLTAAKNDVGNYMNSPDFWLTFRGHCQIDRKQL